MPYFRNVEDKEWPFSMYFKFLSIGHNREIIGKNLHQPNLWLKAFNNDMLEGFNIALKQNLIAKAVE